MAISNHDKGETDQTFTSTFSTSNMNFSLENNSKGANKIREIVPVVPITEKQNENANAWYSKFDTAWYFSTVNDSKPVVKVLEKKVIDSGRSKTNKISKPEQNDVGIKNKMDMKTKLNESPKEPKRFKRSKRGRYLFSNDVSDEFQSQDDIIPNKERENNTQTIIRKGTPITIRTRPPNIPSDSNSENIFHIPIYYESHHLNPKKFWSWKKPIPFQNVENNVNFDDLFIDQKDYEISVRAKFTQCTLLFILFIQFIILLRNEIYSLAIVVLIVIWLILFYFVVRSCFEVKNSLIS
ncbi:hypothetical protein RhiirA5_466388 [Rhizophagus irregularis]|uniref:Uncharacterized protein n=1 Tax=Rhizophagus irregularis TaxID=588596 RepID=A0A2I1DU34_9GLOM|nr:hypothetical protein RhiirA5_466388 [Rhizophagus irregularis]PKY13386.1 hypothetical protein RhiirB3_379232 [Rhizophagus irregularis]CAB4486917.1 unnamed protein product [Rhizophagus irregularis]CAB5192107.1 unnamed protein product [Rhizophagus irregularis]CAB5335555.1 unnamed protein product [Rhizophagus irregularis]